MSTGGDGGMDRRRRRGLRRWDGGKGGGEKYFLEVVETRRVLRGRKLDGYIEDGGFKGRIWI